MYSDIVVVNFSGTDIHRRLQDEFFSLYHNYFLDIIGYTLDGLKKTNYYQEHYDLFRYNKYSGYFIWKPYIILETMKQYPDKMVLYCDSNLRFKDLPKVYDYINGMYSIKNYFLLGHINYINRHWTKRDTFTTMHMDEEKYWNAHQIWTSFMGFKKDYVVDSLLKAYQYYCGLPECVVDGTNISGLENLDGFIEHRWEQSVMSLLVKQMELSYHWDYKLIPHALDKIYPEELMEQKKHGF